MGKQRRRFILGSNKYRHKPISNKLIKQIQLIRSQLETKTKRNISFVWITDNLQVRLKTK